MNVVEGDLDHRPALTAGPWPVREPARKDCLLEDVFGAHMDERELSIPLRGGLQ